MSATYLMKFKVNKQQRDRIRTNASEQGYLKVARYLRNNALRKTCLLEKKVRENNKHLKRILEVLLNE